MQRLLWKGTAGPPALRAALASSGWTIVRSLPADDPARLPVIVGSREADSPPKRLAELGDRWLWCCQAEVPLAAAREAVAAGAYDVVSLLEPDALPRLLARLAELGEPEPELPVAPGIVAASPAARRLLRRIGRVAPTSVPVLLVGETGSGKEQMAGLVHRWSGRRGPWMPINCAAIPNDLMESELFGHARGAFSGAVASVDGKLLAAEGGTVFLDEIDDTPLSIQMKLLRVLEDGEVTRVGETAPRRADFRLVAATNRDLLALVAEERFGRDLYERLAIVRVDLPPLRERREDIGELAAHFVRRFYELHPARPRIAGISPRALAALEAHSWPGNIRELRNVVFHALVEKHAGDEILLSDLPRLVEAGEGGSARPVIDERRLAAEVAAGTFNLRRERERLERLALGAALAAGGSRPARAARLLGEVGRGAAADPAATVRAMMRRLGVTKQANGGVEDRPSRDRSAFRPE